MKDLAFSSLQAWVDGLSFGGMDESCYRAARARQHVLTKPRGSLGRLEDIACWLAGWQGRARPSAETVGVHLYAGNHGIASKGVSAYPPEVTAQMVENFVAGGAAVNQLCGLYGYDLQVHVADLDKPTRDFSQQTAMDEETCLQAVMSGYESVVHGTEDIIVLGEMGIGNSTAAAALCHACFGGNIDTWVGRGSGVDEQGFARKRSVLRDAVAYHAKAQTLVPSNPWVCLQAFGGYEIAACLGAVLAARTRSVAVILDGFICCSAAAVLYGYKQELLDHCLFGHISAEAGHALLLQKMDKKPLLSLDMRLGEGSGGVLAASLVQAAVMCHNGMASFDEAGVSDKES
ncbi:MAG: nicotinate-nucleotide--dimethylbenzimidazole phosphoribosyltransferase [Alphaproteobacteria bacterium GM202ARS2]|nr:nicotinate-nucleotide--dimethylbenzimidazole phosphoribosyltransferase [Alphaproteobacteria bacterium GM202ARS2]